MLAVTWGMRQLLAPWLAGMLLQQILAIAAIVLVAVLSYGSLLQLLRLPEYTLITKKFRQRFARRPS